MPGIVPSAKNGTAQKTDGVSALLAGGTDSMC